MQSRIAALLLTLPVLWMLGSCGSGSSFISDAPIGGAEIVKPDPVGIKAGSAYADPNIDFTWDLIAGQNMYAGTVHVYNDASTLYVAYSLFDGWLMEEAHVLVSASEPGEKDGKPGQFPFKEEFDPPVSSYTFEIPLAEFPAKSKLYIATHAATTNGETIWGGYWNDGDAYYDFEWKKWGGGFCTNIMPFQSMPDEWIWYKASHWGAYSYWGVTLLDLPPAKDFPGTSPYGYYISPDGNDWVGWCTDPSTMSPGSHYNVKMYSCYDPNLPAYAQSDNWDLISYLITQRNMGEGIYDVTWTNTNKQHFQDAVWYFKYGTSGTAKPSGLGGLFVDDAIANGENFIPGPGEYYAVILWPGANANGTTKFQMNIIEVDP